MKKLAFITGLISIGLITSCKDQGANNDDPTSPGIEERANDNRPDPHDKNDGNYQHDDHKKADSTVQNLPDTIKK